MTNREFYQAIVDANVTEELTEFALAAIEKMDASNSKAREKAAEKAAEKEAEKAPIRAALLAQVSTEPKTATMLIEAAGVDCKPQSIPSLFKPLVEDGTIVKVDMKVEGKKGLQRGYQLA